RPLGLGDVVRVVADHLVEHLLRVLGGVEHGVDIRPSQLRYASKDRLLGHVVLPLWSSSIEFVAASEPAAATPSAARTAPAEAAGAPSRSSAPEATTARPTEPAAEPATKAATAAAATEHAVDQDAAQDCPAEPAATPGPARERAVRSCHRAHVSTGDPARLGGQ